MGTADWTSTWGGGNGYEHGNALVQTADGGYAITGYTDSFGAGAYDMYVAKFDTTGTYSWSQTWGGTDDDKGNGLVERPDGSLLVLARRRTMALVSTICS